MERKPALRYLLFIAAFFLFSGESFPQRINFSNAGEKAEEANPYTDLTVGYAPNKGIHAFKFSASINNLFIERIGAYTSFEKSFKSNYFSNIIGGTVRVYRTAYLFGGIDVFTKDKGFFSKYSIKGLRKEIGAGVSLFTYVTFRLGVSFSVGPTFTTGIKIPLNKEKLDYYFYLKSR